MKLSTLKITRLSFMLLTWLIWWWTITQPFSITVNLILIIGSLLLIFPAIWLAKVFIDRLPTTTRADWMTTFVHYIVGNLLGISAIRAVLTHQTWPDWTLPIPQWIGLTLMIITGAATLFSVLNLALKGIGAPFVIALSKKVAADWMYAWTRNPMVLSGIAFMFSLGIWFQSGLFLLWALLFSQALLFFVKIYEERELAIRFGESYLAYKAKTPFLFPRKPRI